MGFLLCPFGSHGDLHPFVGLGVALQRRGHAVTVAACDYYQDLIESSGLEFVELGKTEQFIDAAKHPDLWHPMKAFPHLVRTSIGPMMRPQFDLIAERASREPTIVVANLLGFGARMAQEKLGVPLATIHLQPSVLWSEYDSPRLPPAYFGPKAPRWLKRSQYWLGERFIIDRIVNQQAGPLRRELGLPPIRRTTRWWHSPDLVVCLFPEWFAPRQPDWPANVRLTQFPLWDEDTVHPPQAQVEAFLAEGEPPIVFTPGSGNMQAESFFEAAADACLRLKRRGMLLSRFGEQLPAHLPDGVRHFDYVPFSRLLPRAAALVHHGGIGTASQGMRAGVPQLIMPLAHDQPDNAMRLKRLGVGDFIWPKAFRGSAVAERLEQLLGSKQTPIACREVARQFEGVEPFAQACEALEELASRKMEKLASSGTSPRH